MTDLLTFAAAAGSPGEIPITHDFLVVIWFLLLGVLLAGYAILDGFDLGVGILHAFVPKDETERRLAINAIGPLWDGNEVWLVTFGGAMFAMFPYAYATLFSGFYTGFMLLLVMLIFRAASIEMRGKMASSAGRRAWDYAFFAASVGAAFLFGVAAGNVVLGVPLDERGTMTSGILDHLNPYALLTGATTVSVFAMHGGLYLHMKIEGEFQDRLERVIWTCFGIFLTLFLIQTMWTLVEVPRATANFRTSKWLWVVPMANVLAVANIPRSLFRKEPAVAFVSSSFNIFAYVFLLLTALWPDIVVATDPAHSLSLADAASSDKTLIIGLIVVAIGMPFVLAYSSVVYWTFRGKVRLEPHSY
ncbi:MAG: cytochrome d ubiquinol oxidase subunit II [Isosphaeraceae bacterium]